MQIALTDIRYCDARVRLVVNICHPPGGVLILHVAIDQGPHLPGVGLENIPGIQQVGARG